MTTARNFVDPVWIERYAQGHEERYPWDLVVTFVMSNRPKNTSNDEISILEVGCGTGSNLWFAAREGFEVSGIEASADAVDKAMLRFKKDGLTGVFRVGDFCDLPFSDGSFDLVIDRASLVCVDEKRQQKAVDEIHRCLKPGGRFLHNTYTSDHACTRSHDKNSNGMHGPIVDGSVAGAGELRFSSLDDIEDLFKEDWVLRSLEQRTWSNMLSGEDNWHREWVVIVEKASSPL